MTPTTQAGWTDTVVWNPHTTLPGDQWKSFCCVESAAISAPVVLEPEKAGTSIHPTQQRQPPQLDTVSKAPLTTKECLMFA